jgi:hypothetical protein
LKKFLAGVALAAAALLLGAAAPARAEDTTYELDAVAYQSGVGRVADTELDLYFPSSTAAPAAITTYVPAGYTLATGQAAGTQVGVVDGGAVLFSGAERPITGSQIVADDPAKHAGDACAPGTHTAVWIANVTIDTGGGPLTIPVPIYVDPTTGVETARGSYKLQVCLPSPYNATPSIRATEVDLDFPQVFTNPATRGIYIWKTYVVPYTVGTATANLAGMTEVRSDVAIPQTLSLKSKAAGPHKAIITGSLIAAGIPRAGINVRFVAGPTRDISKMKAVGKAVTKRNGKFSFTLKVTKTTYVWAYVNVYAGPCDGATDAPGGCALETLSPAFAPGFLKVVVPKKKK